MVEGGKRDRQKNTTGVCMCGKERQTEIHNWNLCGKERQTEEHDCGETGGWIEKQNGRDTAPD